MLTDSGYDALAARLNHADRQLQRPLGVRHGKDAAHAGATLLAGECGALEAFEAVRRDRTDHFYHRGHNSPYGQNYLAFPIERC